MSIDDVKERLLVSAAAKGWKKVGVKAHHGINVPLSAIHSKQSQGIGDFYDLKLLVSFCKQIGFDTIQLLPINDTAEDPSPYNAISSCALHPIYLSLLNLPFIQEDKTLLKQARLLCQMNQAERVLYIDVLREKKELLAKYIKKFGKRLLAQQKVQRFLDSQTWIKSYALFKTLKESNGNTHFSLWPHPLQSPTEEEFSTLLEQHAEQVTMHSLIQYLCFEQMSAVKTNAFEEGVWIKGDIPILISQDSADVWSERELFCLDFSAGAPPDFYNKDGQYWGFPLYNWSVMRLRSFAWWKRRLSYAQHFYDMYRLDHVIGFFRIWAILHGSPPCEGRFIPDEESLWGLQGREILCQLCSFSDMLPIAEDLGLVPEVVRPTLASLGICSTKIMRWERFWDKDGGYRASIDYPPVSMTSLSTHDSPTLAQWWRDFPEEVAPLCLENNWPQGKELSTEIRMELLRASHSTSSLFHINLLQEYLPFFPKMCHKNIDDERINVPGKVLPSNWTYKYIPSLEELLAHEGLKTLMHSLTQY